jgi:hypothetical protein
MLLRLLRSPQRCWPPYRRSSASVAETSIKCMLLRLLAIFDTFDNALIIKGNTRGLAHRIDGEESLLDAVRISPVCLFRRLPQRSLEQSMLVRPDDTLGGRLSDQPLAGCNRGTISQAYCSAVGRRSIGRRSCQGDAAHPCLELLNAQPRVDPLRRRQ